MNGSKCFTYLSSTSDKAGDNHLWLKVNIMTVFCSLTSSHTTIIHKAVWAVEYKNNGRPYHRGTAFKGLNAWLWSMLATKGCFCFILVGVWNLVCLYFYFWSPQVFVSSDLVIQKCLSEQETEKIQINNSLCDRSDMFGRARGWLSVILFSGLGIKRGRFRGVDDSTWCQSIDKLHV